MKRLVDGQRDQALIDPAEDRGHGLVADAAVVAELIRAAGSTLSRREALLLIDTLGRAFDRAAEEGLAADATLDRLLACVPSRKGLDTMTRLGIVELVMREILDGR